MRSFRHIGCIDMSVLAMQLDAHRELWDQRTYRTDLEPFKGTSDIWLRWRNPDELASPEAHREPHYPVFYPAWYTLTAAHPIVALLVKQFRPSFLGAILITRIPSGGSVRPHRDDGWHPRYCNQKFYCVMRGNDRCVNYAEANEKVVMKTGDYWWFDNTVTHWVENDGEEDRISLIVCMRTKEAT